MHHLIYGTDWNPDFQVMFNPMSVDDARHRYESGEVVMVAAGFQEMAGCDIMADEVPPGRPADWTLYAELDRGVVQVEFYLPHGSRVATYDFDLQPDGRLFLVEVGEYEFLDPTKWPGNPFSSLTVTLFRPDGSSGQQVYRSLPDGGQSFDMTEYRGDSHPDLWEPVPTFGDWESIIRRRR